MKDEVWRPGVALVALAVLLSSFLLLPSSLAEVSITFLPPPMEGTVSMGIYSKTGKLVRVLHREATEKNFTVGLNGFMTTWDGKDDAGRTVPVGSYGVRGYVVGSVSVEGVAIHGNDWVEEDNAPRPVSVTDLRVRDLETIEILLKTAAGGERVETIAMPTPPTDSAVAAQVVEGKVMIVRGAESREFPLDEGESALDAKIGAEDGLWVVVKNAEGTEVRQFSLDGEFLRRLAYAPGDPLPRRIIASRSEQQILLFEENAKMQRVRSLIRTVEPAPENADAAAPPAEPASVWKTVLEKSIWRGASFDEVNELLVRPDDKPFVPEKEFVVKLINNPLVQGEPTSARVNIGVNARGSFLQTTDGLPLRRITETPRLKWAVIGREGSGKLLTILQSDGAAVEEFRAGKLANMMMFDAGDYEWEGAGK